MKSRMKCLLVLMLTLTVTVCGLNGSEIALAQAPQPNANGDYERNETPVQGSVPPGMKLQPGSLWEVVSPGLNCRQQAKVDSPIVKQFQAGDRLQAEVFRGGSDEVLLNAKDANGKPWMFVRSNTFKGADACYVRANQRYIKPVTQPL